jgi:hypothetical protein
MSKKAVKKESGSKKEIKQIVEKSLETLLVKIAPGMGEKKFRKRIKLAGKILSKGVKAKATEPSEIASA